jgi:glyoxylase I family protein
MRVHHLAFRTTNLPRLERFYVDVVGLPCLRRNGERSVWLDADGTIVMLEAQGPEEPRIDATTMELVCFEITADRAELQLERLRAAGIPIEARTDFTVYVRDPDGRRIGFSSYPTATLPR